MLQLFMKNKKQYFDYSAPSHYDLQEMYMTPYRFSTELRDYVNYMFSHPQHNKYHKIFSSNMNEWDSNDMLKPAYLLIKYYLDYPHRFNNDPENIVPHILVRMWKTFLGKKKTYNKVQFKQYYPTSMKLLVLGNNRFLDLMINDIQSKNVILHEDDMIKRREGVDLRERRQRKQSKYIDYLVANYE